MRVFLTGATGFVGSAIARELIAAGHEVAGLARSDANAAALVASGVEPHRGDLNDLESLRDGASKADAAIHTAFIHDYANFQASCETDRLAIEAIGSAMVGTDRRLIVTSGTAASNLMTPGRVGTEADQSIEGFPRVSEQVAASLASRGVNASVIRLPISTHGDGDRLGFVSILIGIAREKGLSAYVGDGQNRWPAGHRLDAAVLYRLALERGTAGARYHAVADEGVPFREIAAVIGRRLGVPVVSQTPAEAAAHFGWFGTFTGADIPASSQQTRDSLGWEPVQPGLIADIDDPRYFGG